MPSSPKRVTSGSSSPVSPADFVARNAPSVHNIREGPQGAYSIPFQHKSHASHSSYGNQDSSHNSSRAAKSVDDNRPDRFELFLLGDGEKKVVEEADTRRSHLISSRRAECIAIGCSSHRRGLVVVPSYLNLTLSG